MNFRIGNHVKVIDNIIYGKKNLKDEEGMVEAIVWGTKRIEALHVLLRYGTYRLTPEQVINMDSPNPNQFVPGAKSLDKVYSEQMCRHMAAQSQEEYTIVLDYLHRQVKYLNDLLSNPEPGSWQWCQEYGKRMTIIAEFWKDPKATVEKYPNP